MSTFESFVYTKSFETLDSFMEELEKIGYIDGVHYYFGNGEELIIINDKMFNDNRVKEIFKKYNVIEENYD